LRVLPVVMAAVLACALVGAYVALGGTSYQPSPVADPCVARAVRPAADTAERLEHVLLAAADGTACELGVSREELVLALRSVDDLDALAAKTGKSQDELEAALRAGLVRAVDEGQRERLIGGTTAGSLHFAADHLPLGLLLSLLRGASSLFG